MEIPTLSNPAVMNKLRFFTALLLLTAFSFLSFGQSLVTKRVRLSTAPIRKTSVRSAKGKSVKTVIDLLVTGGTVVTMNANHTLIEDGAIAIKGDNIVAVGPRTGLAK